MLRLTLLWVTLCIGFIAESQPKILKAVKAVQAPKIDGSLEDEVWKEAPLASDFIQNFPKVGQSASVKTEVRILYDNNAVYIGAYLYDDPSQIRKQLTARDGESRQDVDFFSVFFDTYHDLQNGFQFLVTSNNVQTDAKLDPDANPGYLEYGDRSWDAVWESKTSIRSDGWVVEMRIPYISLRFAKKDVQTWGLQFNRFTRRNNESSFWNNVDPNVNGFVNQFGKLQELRDILPPLRLSFSPYLSTGVRMNPEGTRKSSEWLRSGGMDLKYGVNESFTLDATLIPDFGQVISDNVINNLSAFEVQFQENRPFFTEGTELFNKAGLFYSRRIGRQPDGYSRIENLGSGNDYEILSNPSVTQLYNAIKFSGRTRKNLGIGVFNAVTAPMQARLRNSVSKQDTLVETEPLSNYNIIVLDQPFNGRSSITFTNTSVLRDGHSRDANVSALDWSLFTRNNSYRLQGTARYSKIFGFTPFPGGINLVYDTVRRDGRLYVKPYDGYETMLRFEKVDNQLRFYAENTIISNTYDHNDLGYLQTPNQVSYNGGISFNQLKPTKNFLQYRYSIDVATNYLYKPYKYAEVELSASAFYYFRNFWDLTLSVSSYPTAQYDYFDLRTPGKFFKRPAEATFRASGSTDSRKRMFFSWDMAYASRAKGENLYYRGQFGLRYRFSDRFTLSANWFRQYEQNQIGYAFIREANGEPILGYRNFTEIQSILSGIYNFTPRLNLTFRTRHYWNLVRYNSFFNVDGGGNHVPRGFVDDMDENYNVWNLDAFLTWDFRLGSRIVLGWKNWLGDSYAVDGKQFTSYVRNLKQVFDLSHGNEITLRVIYFLDYNSFKKRR